MEERLWPYPLKPESEWTAFDKEHIDLMQAAFEAGFQPCEFDLGVRLGKFPIGRSIRLVRRGSRNGWELVLADNGNEVSLGLAYQLPLKHYACVCVRPPFRDAAHFALEWMRGREIDSLLSDFEFVGGRPPGLVLKASLSSE